VLNLDLIIDHCSPFSYSWKLWGSHSRVVAEGHTRTLFGARHAGAGKAKGHLVAEDCSGWLYTRLRQNGETRGRALGSRSIVVCKTRRQWGEPALRQIPICFAAEQPVKVTISPLGTVRVQGARKVVVRP
jgi:hypothetical protein